MSPLSSSRSRPLLLPFFPSSPTVCWRASLQTAPPHKSPRLFSHLLPAQHAPEKKETRKGGRRQLQGSSLRYLPRLLRLLTIHGSLPLQDLSVFSSPTPPLSLSSSSPFLSDRVLRQPQGPPSLAIQTSQSVRLRGRDRHTWIERCIDRRARTDACSSCM